MSKFFAGMVATLLFLGPGIGLSADEGQPLTTPKLSAENTELCKFVLPNAGEASFRKIPWRTSVMQGIVDAQKNDKPVMIYLMNGHPLGCT